MGRLSIRWSLLLLVGGAIAACLLVGLVGANGTWTLGSSVDRLLDSQSAVRRQTEADMMHDAIRADVLGALYAQATGNLERIPAISDELREHGDKFLQLMQANREVVTAPAAVQQLNKITPFIERYINSAGQIVTEPAQGAAHLSGFEQDFSLLEGEMEALTDAIEQSSQGEVDLAEAQVASSSALIAGLSIIFGVLLLAAAICLLRLILQPLALLSRTAQEISVSGDLNLRVNYHGENELGKAITEFNRLMDALQRLVAQARKTSGSLGQSMGTISQLAARVGEDAGVQSRSADAMSNAVSQMTDNIQQLANRAEVSLGLAREVGQRSAEGGQVVQESAAGMARISQTVHQSAAVVQGLEQDIQQIGNVTSIIKGIAEQTNLLALNAAIEAARAGDMGRGFAVVADEVRSLAARTAHSTQEIVEVIQRIQEASRKAVSSLESGVNEVEDGVLLARRAGDAVTEISQRASEAEATISEIYRMIDEQRLASEQFSDNVGDVSRMASHTHGEADKVLAELGSLNQLVNELGRAMDSLGSRS